MNAPNIISLGRLLAVPVTVWLILSGEWLGAFVLFVAAGISDAVDGYIAKRFEMRTTLGAFLDPLADKALLVSIYVALGTQNKLPAWLVILVVSRDLLIVGGVLLSFAMDLKLAIKPLFVSKLNTVLQIALIGLVLANLALFDLPVLALQAAFVAVAATTILSGAQYLVQWGRGQQAPPP